MLPFLSPRIRTELQRHVQTKVVHSQRSHLSSEPGLFKLSHYTPRKFTPKGFKKADLKIVEKIKAPPWCRQTLEDIKTLLLIGKNDEALRRFLETQAAAPVRPRTLESQVYFRRGIWLFTHSMDFQSAVTLVNKMIGNKIPISPAIWMCLLTQFRQLPRPHLQQVFDAITSHPASINDTVMAGLLYCARELGMKAYELERLVRDYERRQGPGWVPGAHLVSPIIVSYALEGDIHMARSWLDNYRASLRRAERLVSVSRLDQDLWWLLMDFFRERKQKTEKKNMERKKRKDNGIYQYSTAHAAPPAGPYTAFLTIFRDSYVPQLPQLEQLLLAMKEDNVGADTYFFNKLIDIFTRWKLGKWVFDLYFNLITSSSHPYPNSNTFRKMFISFPEFAKDTPDETGKYPYGLNPRQIWRHVLAFAVHEADPKGPIKREILHLNVCTWALRAFLLLKDYPAAIVVLRAINTYFMATEQERRTLVKPRISEHILERWKTDPEWAQRAGRRFKNLVDFEVGNNFLLQIGLHRDPIGPHLDIDIWVYQEWVRRAMRSDLGYPVLWKDHITWEGNDEVDAAVAAAEAEMTPTKEEIQTVLEKRAFLMRDTPSPFAEEESPPIFPKGLDKTMEHVHQEVIAEAESPVAVSEALDETMGHVDEEVATEKKVLIFCLAFWT